MTALVASSASAQATETDLAGLQVRSKPATGTPPRGARGVAPTGSPLTGSAQATNIRSRCCSVTSSAGAYAPPAVEVSEAGAHEHPGRGTGGGVVAGQRVGALPRPVAGGHRAQEVAVAAAQADPADRDQWRLSWAAPRWAASRKERPVRPGYPRSGRLVRGPAWPVPRLCPERKGETGCRLFTQLRGGCRQARNQRPDSPPHARCRGRCPRMPRVYGSPTQRDGLFAGGVQTAS